MTRHKSALITGASRGIGEAFARALPSDTNLILCGRDESALSELSGALTTDRRAVRIVVADLSKADGRDRVVRTAEDAHIDLLINNAGIGKFGGFLDVERDDHLKTVDVNISAILDFTHRLVPGMIARARSSRRAGLINVASSAAFAPVPKFAVYAASKAFVLSFSEALTSELRGQPIDILAFCPGAVRTEFGRTAGYRQRKRTGGHGYGSRRSGGPARPRSPANACSRQTRRYSLRRCRTRARCVGGDYQPWFGTVFGADATFYG